MTKKTAILSGAAIFVLAAGLIWMAKTSTFDPDPAKHAPMELFGIGPEMFQDRATAWVKAFAEIVKIGIAELGVIVAAIILFLQNAKTGRELKQGIQDTKQEMAQRFHNQGQRINDVALAVSPTAAPAEPPAS